MKFRSEPISQKKVLIVEDDPALAYALQVALSSQQLTVDLIDHGDLILPAVSTNGYELIFLDIMLPGKDGFSILKELRSLHQTQHIPIIIMTNLGESDHIEKALALGASDYILKAHTDIKSVHKLLKKHLVFLTARYHTSIL